MDNSKNLISLLQSTEAEEEAAKSMETPIAASESASITATVEAMETLSTEQEPVAGTSKVPPTPEEEKKEIEELSKIPRRHISKGQKKRIAVLSDKHPDFAQSLGLKLRIPAELKPKTT